MIATGNAKLNKLKTLDLDKFILTHACSDVALVLVWWCTFQGWVCLSHWFFGYLRSNVPHECLRVMISPSVPALVHVAL